MAGRVPKTQTCVIFPKAGLKISYVVGELVDELGGVDALEGLTTERVCQDIIMEKTRGGKWSYCDMMKQQCHAAYAAKAAAFISHAHSYLFLDLISALQWLFRNEPDTIVWIDLFSINQHVPMDWTFDWLSTTFKSAVDLMGRTVMVMSPWNNPLPFTRAWCVFEAYCTAVTNSRFEIAMSKTDERTFLRDIDMNADSRMNQMLATIRAEKSQCSVESDRVSIFSVVEETIGFARLDSMLFERYRKWVIQVSRDALENFSDLQKRSSLLDTVGVLYSSQGRYDIRKQRSSFLNV
jgi:hypothetical protein